LQKRTKRALTNWRRLAKGLLLRERLKVKFKLPKSSPPKKGPEKNERKFQPSDDEGSSKVAPAEGASKVAPAEGASKVAPAEGASKVAPAAATASNPTAAFWPQCKQQFHITETEEI
jgi:hypothetical protein